jgi:uncharacterized protein YdaU (DUF1376 family)
LVRAVSRDKARKRERLVGACVLKFYYPDAESWTEKEGEEERGKEGERRGERRSVKEQIARTRA